jgi:hypothetical protein
MKVSESNTPKLPSKPVIGLQGSAPTDAPKLPSKPLLLPPKPVIEAIDGKETATEVASTEAKALTPVEAAVKAIKEKESLKIDPETGYEINPSNGLLIVPDLNDVALPKPSLPANPREIKGVDSQVDTVVIGDIKSFGEAKNGVPDTIDVEDWDDNTDNDPVVGLGAEKEKTTPVKRVKLGKGLNITDRDIIMMKFMARYRYAYVDQLARLVNAEPKDIKTRLKKLELEGLIRSEAITAGQDIYLTRKSGNAIIDIDFPEIKKGQVSFITVAHTIGLANLGVELEMATGGKNILGEEDYPTMNRYYMGVRDPYSEPTEIGEMTVTEREIRRGNRLFRGNKTTEDMRLLAEAAFEDHSGPELLEGSEGLFVVYGKGKDGEHVPDLVVARPRGENGEARHIAIELELTPKNNSEWIRILRWYRDHGFFYEKIYYFTHKRTLADALKKAAEHVGISDKVIVRKYVPINNRGPFWG